MELTNIKVKGTVLHSTGSVTMRVYSGLNQPTDDESWGMREVSLLFDSSSAAEGFCIACTIAATSGNCPCADGQYMDGGGTCRGCNSLCTSCYGPSTSQCDQCASGVTYYNNQCIRCDSSCLTCTGSAANQCLTCYSGAYYYNNQYCYICSTGCASCSGTGSNQCLSCTGTKYLYINQCIQCDSSCQTCSGTAASQCLSCYSGAYYYNNQYCFICSTGCASCSGTGSNQCLSCTGTKYLYINQCIQCDSSCQTCSGTAASQCLSCYSGAYYYNNQYCFICSTGCATCSGTGSTQCLSCTGTKYLYINQCIQCDSSCQTCSGTAASQCLSCYSPAYYYNSQYCFICSTGCATCSGTATNQCNSCTGTLYLYSHQCFQCHLTCATCSGTAASQCLSCYAPDYYYNNQYCFTCHASCKTCFGTAVNQCLSCYAPDYYYNNQYCFTCHASCKTCFGTAVNQCLSCYGTDYYYNNQYCFTCHSTCATCSGIAYNQCLSCTGTLYLYQYTCIQCDSTCATCRGTTSTDCLSCYTDRRYWARTYECFLDCPYPLTKSSTDCTSPCAQADFVYWDRSCAGTCSPNYQSKNMLTNTVKLCIFPCSPVEYMYWDGSCQHDCLTPLTTDTDRGMRLCKTTCPTNYLYWDVTCGGSCLAPFKSRTQNAKSFCMKPCGTGYFVDWNNNCVPTCTFPLSPRTTQDVDYCDYPYCSTLQYLTWYQGCKSTCDYPLQTRSERGRLFCDWPIAASSYLYWDGSSTNTCDYPLTSSSEGTSGYVKYYCNYPCAIDEYLYWDQSCVISCDYPLSPRISNSRQFCDYGCATSGQYLYWNGSCLATCPQPLQIRSAKGRSFCDYNSNISLYLYWDRSSAMTCNAPLSPRTEGSPLARKFCDFPCTTTTDFLYWNGTCKSTCPSPLSSRSTNSRNFCDFPCTINQWLYINGSCFQNCDSPLKKQNLTTGGNFCSSPCTTSTDFYYSNGTCLSTCPLPYQTQTFGAIKWCTFPCMEDQYLYQNGFCLSSCGQPLTAVTESGYKKCINPCVAPKFLAWNGSCLDYCDPPLRTITAPETGSICLLPCENIGEYYYLATGGCDINCDHPSTSSDLSYLTCLTGQDTTSEDAETTDSALEGQQQISIVNSVLDAPSIPGTRTVVAPTPATSYLRYLNISMSPRLQNFANSFGKSLVSMRFSPSLSDNSTSTSSATRLLDSSSSTASSSGILANPNLRGNFFLNFMDELSSWSIAIIFALICIVLEHVFRFANLGYLAEISKRLRIIFQWNLLVVLIATSVGNVIFFTSIEIISASSKTPGSVVGAEVCAFVVAIVVGLVVIGHVLVKKYQEIKQAKMDSSNITMSEKELEFEKIYPAYQAMFKGFNDTQKPNQFFFILYMIRLALPMLVCAWLYSYPFIEVSFFVLFSVCILAYLIVRRPLIRKVNHWQLVIFESITLAMNVCLFILKVVDMMNIKTQKTVLVLGDGIILCNSALNTVSLVFLIIKLFMAAKAIHAYNKDNKNRDPRRHILWVQLIALFVQQTGMGFEEIFISAEAEALFSDPFLLFKQKGKKSKNFNLLLAKSTKQTEVTLQDQDSRAATPEVSYNGDTSKTGFRRDVNSQKRKRDFVMRKTEISTPETNSDSIKNDVIFRKETFDESPILTITEYDGNDNRWGKSREKMIRLISAVAQEPIIPDSMDNNRNGNREALDRTELVPEDFSFRTGNRKEGSKGSDRKIGSSGKKKN